MEELTRIIDALRAEAFRIQLQGRALRPDEIDRVRAINQSLPLLEEARRLLEQKSATSLITYKIVADREGKLKAGARTACNFWNRYVAPRYSIVVRLGTFYADSTTIARAYEPYERDDVRYGVVEFNTKYLDRYSPLEIGGTIAHEIGHTLGFGWETWMELFDPETGEFHPGPISKLDRLGEMEVERDYGPGTELSHWDEERFTRELMTGLKDPTGEFVLPVTIDVMALLGHRIIERLERRADLDTLLRELSRVQFTRRAEAKALDLDHFVPTDLFEEIPHPKEVEGDE